MSSNRYISGIDGLRALAVLSVIFFHLGVPIIPGGFTGVDVFFVISGYVVTGSLVAACCKETQFSAFALGFYARRLLRIYPALVVCLLVSVFAQVLFVPASWLSLSSEKAAISAFFGFSNFSLISSNDGYFSPRVEFNPFTHTWSLAVEEQFYLLFPGLFYLWYVGNQCFGAKAIVARAFLPLLLVASLIFARHETVVDFDRAYFLLPSRFWELLAGALLLLAHDAGRLKVSSSFARQGLAALGLSLIVLGVVVADKRAFPYPWALLPVVGTLLTITALASSSVTQIGWVDYLLSNRLIVLIGKLSYSLYLWHWPTFVLFKWTVGLERWEYQAVALSITVFIAGLSYQYLEKPIRYSVGMRRFASKRIVVSGLALVFACALSAWVMQRGQSYLTLSVTGNKVDWYPKSWPGTSSSIDMGASKPMAGRTVFVVGDSHAAAYATLMQMLREHQDIAVQEFSKAGCHVASLAEPVDLPCALYVEGVLNTIQNQAKPGDVVMLAALRVPRLGDQWLTFDSEEVRRNWASADAQTGREAALREADQLVTRIEAIGLTVLIDAPKPVFPSPAFRCSDWFNKSNPVCRGGLQVPKVVTLKHRAPVMTALDQLKARHPYLIVWDPLGVLCPGTACSAVSGGVPLFFDGDHLSAVGNRKLFPSFLAVITQSMRRRP